MSNIDSTTEYPQNDTEFNELFSDEEKCVRYLYDLRWPDGFICPSCGSRECWQSKTEYFSGYFKCKCQKKTSITANTKLFSRMREQQEFLRCIWYLGHTNGPPRPAELMEEISVSQSIAYKWIKKIEAAIVELYDRSELSGTVYVGSFQSQYNTRLTPSPTPLRLRAEGQLKNIYYAIGIGDEHCIIKSDLSNLDKIGIPLLKDISVQLVIKHLSQIEKSAEILAILERFTFNSEKYISTKMGGFRSRPTWENRIKQAAIRMAYFENRGLLFYKILKYGLSENG